MGDVTYQSCLFHQNPRAECEHKEKERGWQENTNYTNPATSLKSSKGRLQKSLVEWPHQFKHQEKGSELQNYYLSAKACKELLVWVRH